MQCTGTYDDSVAYRFVFLRTNGINLHTTVRRCHEVSLIYIFSTSTFSWYDRLNDLIEYREKFGDSKFFDVCFSEDSPPPAFVEKYQTAMFSPSCVNFDHLLF